MTHVYAGFNYAIIASDDVKAMFLLSKPRLVYWQLDHGIKLSWNWNGNYNSHSKSVVHSRKYTSKYRLKTVDHFVSASVHQWILQQDFDNTEEIQMQADSSPLNVIELLLSRESWWPSVYIWQTKIWTNGVGVRLKRKWQIKQVTVVALVAAVFFFIASHTQTVGSAGITWA